MFYNKFGIEKIKNSKFGSSFLVKKDLLIDIGNSNLTSEQQINKDYIVLTQVQTKKVEELLTKNFMTINRYIKSPKSDILVMYVFLVELVNKNLGKAKKLYFNILNNQLNGMGWNSPEISRQNQKDINRLNKEDLTVDLLNTVSSIIIKSKAKQNTINVLTKPIKNKIKTVDNILEKVVI